MDEKQKFIEDSKEFWLGAFDCISDDLPDGAWLQAHIDIADNLLDNCCKDLVLERPNGIDGHYIVMSILGASNHKWTCTSPGVWESYYRCEKCGQRVCIRTDSNDVLPDRGCKHDSD